MCTLVSSNKIRRVEKVYLCWSSFINAGALRVPASVFNVLTPEHESVVPQESNFQSRFFIIDSVDILFRKEILSKFSE